MREYKYILAIKKRSRGNYDEVNMYYFESKVDREKALAVLPADATWMFLTVERIRDRGQESANFQSWKLRAARTSPADSPQRG